MHVTIDGHQYRIGFRHFRTPEAAKVEGQKQPFTCGILYEKNVEGNWEPTIHVDTKLHKGDVYDEEKGRKHAIAKLLDAHDAFAPDLVAGQRITQPYVAVKRKAVWKAYFERRKAEIECPCCKGYGVVKRYPEVQ